MSDNLREALESIVWQFGYKGSRDQKAIFYTGGLSTLEEAFEALGWDDPHEVGDECLCDVEGCYEWLTSGTHWDGLYLSLCTKHASQAWQATVKRPAIKSHALEREARRGSDGVLREVAL